MQLQLEEQAREQVTQTLQLPLQEATQVDEHESWHWVQPPQQVPEHPEVQAFVHPVEQVEVLQFDPQVAFPEQAVPQTVVQAVPHPLVEHPDPQLCPEQVSPQAVVQADPHPLVEHPDPQLPPEHAPVQAIVQAAEHTTEQSSVQVSLHEV